MNELVNGGEDAAWTQLCGETVFTECMVAAV